MIRELQQVEEYDELIRRTGQLVLIDFYADWCEPCKWLNEILTEIEPRLSDKAIILKIDSEKFTPLATSFHIRSVPVLILLKNGREVWRMNGFLIGDELVEKVLEFVD